MTEAAETPLVKEITQQLHGLSIEELRAIRDFMSYLLWKRSHGASHLVSEESAEARAIERMQDIDDPTQRITVVEEGEELDEDELNSWLKARGYQN